ncbi:MAG: hypothetical protein ACOC8D_01430 [bacterium]
MEMIQNGGRTVICPECFAHLHLDQPVVEGQEIQCHQCRLIVVIVKEGNALVPTIRQDPQAEQDKTW